MGLESDVEDDYTSDGFENSTVRVLFSSLTEVIVFVFRFESFPSKPCNLVALRVPVVNGCRQKSGEKRLCPLA